MPSIKLVTAATFAGYCIKKHVKTADIMKILVSKDQHLTILTYS